MGCCKSKLRINSISLTMDDLSSIEAEVSKTPKNKKISEIIILPSNRVLVKTTFSPFSKKKIFLQVFIDIFVILVNVPWKFHVIPF